MKSGNLLAALVLAASVHWTPVSAQTPARAAAPRSYRLIAPPPAFDVTEASIPEIQAALASGRTTSVALVKAYLARIAAYDVAGPRLNAMIHMNPRALAEAAALDAERKQGKLRGPMHGVPVIFKDNYGTVDGVTSAGSLALADSRPGKDAFVVAKLRAAGGIIIGKSNMHELAAGITTISSLGGQTRNAYDQARCPGGSSGGTGAAIAASFAAVGWGSDTCGSIRIPAAYGSLFGLRVTQGLASRDGIVPLSHTQDVPGPLARTMTDLAIALDATIGPDPADSTTRILDGKALPHFADSLSKTALRGARIGVFLNYFTDTDPAIADTVRAALRAMNALGAEVVDVRMPTFDSLLAGTAVSNMETKWDLIDYLARVPNSRVHSMREILDQGLYHAALEARFELIDSAQTRDTDAHRKALAKRKTLAAGLVALMDSLHLDALAYPTMRQRPALIGEVQLGSTCTLAAQSGLPALSAPAGFTGDGLPVGIELLGRPFADAHLVAMAYAYEQGGPRRRPPPATPSLAEGRVARTGAATIRYEATAASGAARATATLTADTVAGTLAFDARVSGISDGLVEAVVLRRVAANGSERVVERLVPSGQSHAIGTFTLPPVDRRALLSGALRLAIYTTDHQAQRTEGVIARATPSR